MTSIQTQNFENREPKREIKSLADSIISNAENNGFVPIKKSFVEEVTNCNFHKKNIKFHFTLSAGSSKICQMGINQRS